jgi:hypothetical protein
VLADIVVGLGLLVLPVCFEARVRHVLLVQAPADAFRIQKVNNGLDTRPDATEAVVGDSPCATTSRSNVVGLRDKN